MRFIERVNVRRMGLNKITLLLTICVPKGAFSLSTNQTERYFLLIVFDPYIAS